MRNAFFASQSEMGNTTPLEGTHPVTIWLYQPTQKVVAGEYPLGMSFIIPAVSGFTVTFAKDKINLSFVCQLWAVNCSNPCAPALFLKKKLAKRQNSGSIRITF